MDFSILYKIFYMKPKIHLQQLLGLPLVYFTLTVQGFASFFDDLIGPGNPISRYCQWGECWVQQGIDLVWTWIDDIETERTLSQYIQDVAIYALSFISIIAVLYILYAGFRILIWNWDEEQLKKSKMTIIYVMIWLVVMWLAWSITIFTLELFRA